MALPGYDPADVENWLEEMLSEVDEDEVLSDDELEAVQEGERLTDALGGQTISELRSRSDRETHD